MTGHDIKYPYYECLIVIIVIVGDREIVRSNVVIHNVRKFFTNGNVLFDFSDFAPFCLVDIYRSFR